MCPVAARRSTRAACTRARLWACQGSSARAGTQQALGRLSLGAGARCFDDLDSRRHVRPRLWLRSSPGQRCIEPAPTVACPCGQQGAARSAAIMRSRDRPRPPCAARVRLRRDGRRAWPGAPGRVRTTTQLGLGRAREHAAKRVPARLLATQASQGFAQPQPSSTESLAQVDSPAVGLDRGLVVIAAAAHLAQGQEHGGQFWIVRQIARAGALLQSPARPRPRKPEPARSPCARPRARPRRQSA